MSAEVGLFVLLVVFPALLMASMVAIVLGVVWGIRWLAGLRVGIVAGRITLVVLALLPIWMFAECSAVIDAPPVYLGDEAIDNDSTARSTIILSLVLFPSSIVSFFAVWRLVRSFSDKISQMHAA
ncbi:hypothetical protein [Methylobacterium nonmethylotrophicum]|uniref:Uncharacterized protein n=1 Tax=Methylobacterium nonmethylotrophicum TaxID=1141884 RepID=A0A4Z0NLV0_9HYPH|nr:hypothetical protein [Methylobacterium nonmethylotrophicum]TGD97232.1 hypothetical protein EU555_20975 [Methylobacterium nonmethylotrophicum]